MAQRQEREAKKDRLAPALKGFAVHTATWSYSEQPRGANAPAAEIWCRSLRRPADLLEDRTCRQLHGSASQPSKAIILLIATKHRSLAHTDGVLLSCIKRRWHAAAGACRSRSTPVRS